MGNMVEVKCFECHQVRKHYARGLCKNCYKSVNYYENKKADHVMRKKWAMQRLKCRLVKRAKHTRHESGLAWYEKSKRRTANQKRMSKARMHIMNLPIEVRRKIVRDFRKFSYRKYVPVGSCKHNDRPKYARNMCKSCYHKWLYWNSKEYRECVKKRNNDYA